MKFMRHVRPLINELKKRRPSAPVIVLVIGLTLLATSTLALLRMGLLRAFLQSPGFQGAAVLLAIAAIMFACIQFWDSRRHSVAIEKMAKSMSTRYIGEFPKELDEITEVVVLAARELLIMADFADYASYSKPEACDKLLHGIDVARESGVSVRMLVYSGTPLLETLTSQFQEADFPKIRTSAKFKHYFQEKYSGITEPMTNVDFLKVLQDKTNEVIKHLIQKGVEIGTLSEKIWLFFWLQDGVDAVFLFEDIGAKQQGLAFRTRDGKLLETFEATFKRYWNSAPKIREQVYVQTLPEREMRSVKGDAATSSTPK